MNLDILYEDDELVAINKPNGLLVHRSRIANDATEFAVQLLRDQIGIQVHPVHRLDRKTSGALLFAKSKSTNALLQKCFQERKVEKTYIAIVRGYIPESGTIDYDLTNDDGKTQNAITHYTRLSKYEIALPHGKFGTSRYSTVELKPTTGRFHQLRKHMAHIFHPIIGDRPHGCNKQNRLWKSTFDHTSMLLHASTLSFDFPEGCPIKIQAPFLFPFKKGLEIIEGKHLPLC